MPQIDSADQLELYSEEVQEVLTAVPKWMILWGNSVVFGLVILLLLVSYWIKYPDVIEAKVLVTTSIPPQQIQAAISGEIETLLIADRQFVDAHTALAVLENSANFRDVFRLQAMLDTIKIESQHASFPFYLLEQTEFGEITPAFLLFKNSYLQYELDQQLQPLILDARGQASTLKELQTRLHQLQWQQQLSSSELALASKKVRRDSLLLNEGVMALQEYEQSQLSLLQMRRNINNIELNISQTKEQLELTSLSLQRNTVEQTRENSILANQLIQALIELKTAIKNWELKYVLRSDIAGELSYIRPWTNNESINRGETLFVIVPISKNTFIAQLRTPSHNAGKIKQGQNVLIQLDQYPYTEFGSLEGAVESMALSSDKEGFYYVEVALPKGLRTSYQKEIIFRRELSGKAEILTEDLRLLQRLFYQFKQFL
ncbi:MAG: HlyD family secretion protein [Chitinophagales bacterium]|nr:HlyD family secretion protein [Chitinophagales bacterium]